ncbi:MAG: hypothetical protein WBK46_03110 [Ruminococcus flavefaciens]
MESHSRYKRLVYNEYGKERKISITEPTILLDESISDTVEEYSAIVHECVHAYLHNLFYMSRLENVSESTIRQLAFLQAIRCFPERKIFTDIQNEA